MTADTAPSATISPHAVLDALVVTSLPNILYLTNFTGSSAIVVITADRLHFITDFRYVTAIERRARHGGRVPGPRARDRRRFVRRDARRRCIAIERLARASASRRRTSRVGRHEWLTATLAGSVAVPALVATEGIVERARVRKDAYEVDDAARGGAAAVGGRGRRC